jgi:hypothetical protein
MGVIFVPVIICCWNKQITLNYNKLRKPNPALGLGLELGLNVPNIRKGRDYYIVFQGLCIFSEKEQT